MISELLLAWCRFRYAYNVQVPSPIFLSLPVLRKVRQAGSVTMYTTQIRPGESVNTLYALMMRSFSACAASMLCIRRREAC